jgi:ferritin
MLSKTIEAALNTQVQEEFFSSYLYVSMALYFKRISLPGFAQWVTVQSREEDKHAFRIMDYVHDSGGVVHLKEIAKPKSEWQSPLEVFEDAFRHEHKVTVDINNLMALAHSEKDYATSTMLQWFVQEQVEEETSTSEIRNTLRDYVKDPSGLLFLDKKLSGRKD